MYIPIYAICRIPDWAFQYDNIRFGEDGTAFVGPDVDFEWLLEDVLDPHRGEDNYVLFQWAVLEDGRRIVSSGCSEQPPQSFESAFQFVQEEVRRSMNDLLDRLKHPLESEPPTLELFDRLFPELTPSINPYAFMCLAQMAYAASRAKRYPFSQEFSSWEHWNALDGTECGNPEGTLAVFAWLIHV